LVKMPAMFKDLWVNFATLFFSLKECVVKENKSQSHEEVIADLHTYLEHLNKKTLEMEARIAKCTQKAYYHKLQAEQEATKSGKTREYNRAKLFLKDKKRLQDEQDKAMKFTHVIRQQIDSLTTSELDNIMVDAMRQYNMTATQMGLPDRTREIEELGNDLQERLSEATQLQQMLGDMANPSAIASALSFNHSPSVLVNDLDEEDLMLELDALGSPTAAAVSERKDEPSSTRVKANAEKVDEADPSESTESRVAEREAIAI
jgi:hypothetical protein